MHNIMSTTGVWGVQATMLSLTSPQKNVFKRPEQNVRIFFLPIFIACLEQHIYYVLRKSEIAQFEWAYKAGWFHHFFYQVHNILFKMLLNLRTQQYFLDQLALKYIQFLKE